MLPENLPKRVPFEEVAKAIINSDAMDTHYADYLDFAKAIVKEIEWSSIEVTLEELKKLKADEDAFRNIAMVKWKSYLASLERYLVNLEQELKGTKT